MFKICYQEKIVFGGGQMFTIGGECLDAAAHRHAN